MAPLGPIAFAVLLWGAIAGVALVFCYALFAVLRDAGWIDS